MRGFGGALIGAPVMTLVYRTMAPAMIPRASGALNLLSTVGEPIGTAVVAVVLQARLDARAPLGDDGVAQAFADTFWWVLALPRRRAGRHPPARPGSGRGERDVRGTHFCR